MIFEYKIIADATETGLVNKINELIYRQEGWTPIGGVTVEQPPVRWFYQAVIKKAVGV